MASTTVPAHIVARAQRNALVWDAASEIEREFALTLAGVATELPAPEARKAVRVHLRELNVEPKVARALAAHAVKATR